MTRTAAMIGLLALAIALPLASAQEERPASNDTRPEDAAWIEDCPPDTMCAAGAEEEPSRGDPSGICENCRGEDAPVQYGPEGCIECTGGPVDGGTCMDGQQGRETCDDDVQYLGGPQADAQSGSASAKTVPALGAMGLIAAFVAAVVIVSRRF
jgi:hypothetical protein